MIGKNFEENNLTVALNLLYANKEKIYPAYVSKHNLKSKKQVILLMIPKGKGQYYIAAKIMLLLLLLLRGMSSKHDSDYHCLK